LAGDGPHHIPNPADPGDLQDMTELEKQVATTDRFYIAGIIIGAIIGSGFLFM